MWCSHLSKDDWHEKINKNLKRQKEKIRGVKTGRKETNTGAETDAPFSFRMQTRIWEKRRNPINIWNKLQGHKRSFSSIQRGESEVDSSNVLLSYIVKEGLGGWVGGLERKRTSEKTKIGFAT